MPDPAAFRLKAPAKINLTLEILGRRSDGYHEISSVMQTVSLADTLTFAPADEEEIAVECDDPTLALSAQSNLVWRAARLVQQVRGVRQGARVVLHKRIPLAAGLGGGSSDAAQTLLGLDRLWGLGLTGDELQNLASLLGSDVPFFLRGGTVLVDGRGEQITPLRPMSGGVFVLITPPFSVPDKTALVYSLLRPDETTDGTHTRLLADTLAAGRLPPATMLYNGLEDAAFRAFGDLDRVRGQVIAAGADSVHVAGAGPSLYVYDPTGEDAPALHAALLKADLPAHLMYPV
ncbi:MAG: 4-(cytidine 5'-diphospho)-2-C-methyl-D-erythritol kinase [Chloroflexia bacterium]